MVLPSPKHIHLELTSYQVLQPNTLRLFKSEVLSRDFGPLTVNARNSYGSYEDALKYKYYAEECKFLELTF